MKRQTGQTDELFRLRGREVSRVEGFTDAVFAFALTLLVVSLEVPQSFADLSRTMQGFAAFASSFAVLFGIWHLHYQFFRLYGLEDGVVVFLNAVLIFVVLFYIYPLKFLFTWLINGLLFGRLLGIRLDVEILNLPFGDMQNLLLIYSTGFLLVFLVFTLMYLHAYRKRGALDLNVAERMLTRSGIQASGLCLVFAVVSIALALMGTPWTISSAGMIYMLLGPAQGLNGWWMGRKIRALA